MNTEPFSKLKLEPLVISDHLYSTFLELLKLLCFLLVLSIEALFFLQQWSPIFNFLRLLACLIIFITLKMNLLSNPNPVYLVDFSCLNPPSFCRVPFAAFLENASFVFDKESVDFMDKILTSSGQSQATYLPPSLHHIPPKTRQQDCTDEAHMLLFPIMDDLLSKTRLSPQHVDFLIVNCSGCCPSPSLSSILVNKYKMRPDVKTYNLSGMGCSAGALAVDLAQNLLRAHNDSNAVVLSAEVLSNGWYSGNEKHKLLLNCTFRMGSAAVLLTNKKRSYFSPKYKLRGSFRTQTAFDDRSYNSVVREEDASGKLGVTITRDLLRVAGESLRSNVSVVGRSILPFSEKLKVGVSVLRKRFVGESAEIYAPDFRKAAQHFCLPPSGRGLIREIAKGLRLGEGDVEAAVMTLHRFGNQSSSSLWYELAYMEAKGKVTKGDKVWLLGMGTGLKCASLVWECLRPIVGESRNEPWAHCIHEYPVHVATS